MTKRERIYRYEVFGMGQFPDDMLRYDRAKVVATRPDPRFGIGMRPRLIYTLEGKCPPTVGRWRSFLYSVNYNPNGGGK
jgi:hypothetical protein